MHGKRRRNFPARAKATSSNLEYAAEQPDIDDNSDSEE